jgi:hypothetical protein
MVREYWNICKQREIVGRALFVCAIKNSSFELLVCVGVYIDSGPSLLPTQEAATFLFLQSDQYTVANIMRE